MKKQPTAVAITDPRQDHLIKLVCDGLRSDLSKRQYTIHLRRFFVWLKSSGLGFCKSSVNAYRQHLQDSGLSSSTINGYLSAIRKLATEAADAKLFPHEDAQAITRAPGMPSQGRRAGNWLDVAASVKLIQAPNPETPTGARDRAILGLLIGCGLRRAELVSLTWEHFQSRESRWVLVDVLGKGSKMRTIPVPTFAANLLQLWQQQASVVNPGGVYMFPALYKAKWQAKVRNARMSDYAVNELVQKYAARTGLQPLAAHDLRRTFAKLAHKGGAPLDQIQLSLGHASMVTTEVYLGVKQDLQDAPCDHLNIKLDV